MGDVLQIIRFLPAKGVWLNKSYKLKYVPHAPPGLWRQEKEILFVWDGWNMIEEITRIGADETSRYFVWGLDLSQNLQGAGGVGGLIATISGTDTYYFCYDGNGNVGQLIDAADGSIAAHYEYDPFGNAIKAQGSYALENPFRFSTKYHDDGTGLVYYGFRYYSPELGRFLTPDPIGLEGGMNLFVYVGGDPINEIDPLGLYGWTDIPGAYYNYCSDGDDWSTDIGSIDWGDANSRISKKIQRLIGNLCSDQTIPVDFVIESQTAGADSKVIGRHNLRVVGTVKLSCDCSWTFSGQISSNQGYDTYNFNPSNRDTSAETQTTIGRKVCKGKPFKIYIDRIKVSIC